MCMAASAVKTTKKKSEWMKKNKKSEWVKENRKILDAPRHAGTL